MGCLKNVREVIDKGLDKWRNLTPTAVYRNNLQIGWITNRKSIDASMSGLCGLFKAFCSGICNSHFCTCAFPQVFSWNVLILTTKTTLYTLQSHPTLTVLNLCT